MPLKVFQENVDSMRTKKNELTLVAGIGFEEVARDSLKRQSGHSFQSRSDMLTVRARCRYTGRLTSLFPDYFPTTFAYYP